MNAPNSPSGGLRARKKRETENAIENAAVDLALELGFDATTVEAICERAGISRSTFFNYFPSRETAITGRMVQLLRGDDADRILDEHAPDLAHGMLALVLASIGHAHINSDVARKRAQLSAEQPDTITRSTGSLLAIGAQLLEVGVGWLVRRPEHARLPGDPGREAVIAAGLCHAAFSSIMVDAASNLGDLEVSDDDITRAFDAVRVVLD